MIHLVEASRSSRPVPAPRGGNWHCGGALVAVTVTLAGTLAACGPSETPAPAAPEPDVETLRASFIAQIESIDLVANLEADGDDIRFVRPDGSGEDVQWRVRIDSLEVQAGSGEGAQALGHVLSAWSADGRPITVWEGSTGPQTDMPLWVLDAGLATDCWALWDDAAKAWSWT